jgi:hypothetical protein
MDKPVTTLSDAPCDKCGYNGPGYYQQSTHPCSEEIKTTNMRRCSRCSEREADPSILCALMVPPGYCRANIKTPTTLTEEEIRQYRRWPSKKVLSRDIIEQLCDMALESIRLHKIYVSLEHD